MGEQRRKEPQQEAAELVGRRRELQALGELVRAGRSVIVSGPPGIGKSALVRHVAQPFRAGDWLVVDLHRADTCEAAWRIVGEAVDLGGDPSGESASARAAGRAMRARGYVGVVLDGADVLAEDAGALHELLEELARPVLVSTRRRFVVRGASAVDLVGLDAADAVALYERLARRWTPEVGPRDAVFELCERLENNPLAIAIAASQSDVLPPHKLVERLASNHALRPRRGSDLTGLDEAIGSAWQALSDEHRAVVQTLAAFKSSFPLDLAEALVDSHVDIYGIVAELIDASWLVRADARGEARVRMWDSMRRYAISTLDPSNMTAARHHFVRVVCSHAAALDERVPRRGGEAALARLRGDEAIVLRALNLAIDAKMAEAVELAIATRWLARTATDPQVWIKRLERALASTHADAERRGILRALIGELHMRDQALEHASELLEQACDDVATAPAHTRAEILRLSSVPLAAIDPQAARERLEAALRLVSGPDYVVRAQILERLGFLELRRFRLLDARDLLAQASKLLREHGSSLLQGPVSVGLGYVAMRTGHVEGAVAAFARSVEIYAKSGASRREAEARFNHGVALLALGDLRLARQQMESARTQWRRCAEDRFLAIVGCRLSLIAIELGELDTARQELHDAISAGQEFGDWNNRAIAEAYLALVELAESGRVQNLARVEIALRDLNFEADPDAAATALLLQALGEAQRGDIAASEQSLERLRAIEELVGDEDAYLHGVIETQSSIGAAWLEAETGSDTIGVAARAVRARVPSLLSDAIRAHEEVARLPNPLVRICARALIDRLHRPDTVESLPEPVTFLGMMPPSAAELVVTVHRLGHWFRAGDGEVVDLVSRRPLRLILRSILKSHMADGVPGRSVEELVLDGWPEELVEASSGKNRVYNAVRQLRELGLETALVSGDAGYRFSERTALQVVDTTPSQVTPIMHV